MGKKKEGPKYLVMYRKGVIDLISKNQSMITSYLSQRGINPESKDLAFAKVRMSPMAEEYNHFVRKWHGMIVTNEERKYIREVTEIMKDGIANLKKKVKKWKKHSRRNKDKIDSAKNDIASMKKQMKDKDTFLKVFKSDRGQMEVVLKNREILDMISRGEV